VLKLGEAAAANVNGYSIGLDYCKGRGMCVAECPCGAIRMEPEEI
jgi:Pyruvate/2-oxoacid:ferredoxin oxidoreductase delta subunit